jgi:hypothetical protein
MEPIHHRGADQLTREQRTAGHAPRQPRRWMGCVDPHDQAKVSIREIASLNSGAPGTGSVGNSVIAPAIGALGS